MLPVRVRLLTMAGVWLSCGRAAVAAPAQPAPTAALVDLPFDSVEGSPLTFTVKYAVPDRFGHVPLHVEMKGRGPEVLAAEVARVTGKGNRRFTFITPGRNQQPTVHFAVWYGKVWYRALAPIIRSDPVTILSRRQAAQVKQQQAEAARWYARMKDRLPPGGAVAMLVDDLPGFDKELAAAVAASLRAAGLAVLPLSAAQICNADILSTRYFHTLVLTSSRVYPTAGARAFTRFLAKGGHVVALTAPAMTTPVTKVDGKWMSAADLKRALAARQPARLLFDFEHARAADWNYAAPAGSVADWEIVSPGAAGTGHALHCVVPNYRNWNTLISPSFKKPAARHDLTCLWAKGGPRTTRLALEWDEQDGSRWIATIPLTTEWRHYGLTEYDFHYWHDSRSKGRGGPGDHPDLHNAVRLTVGLAMTHTPMAPGRHEFWVDEIGVAGNPFPRLVMPDKPALPPVEMLTPAYKFYPVTTAVSLKVSDKQSLLPAAALTVPQEFYSVQPRPQGTGFHKHRRRRWVPLLEAKDKAGRVCGVPACVVLNRTGRFARSAVVTFALPSRAMRSPRLLAMIPSLVQRLHNGLFLFEGGAEYYAYFQGEAMVLGAQTLALGTARTTDCSVRLSVRSDRGLEFQKTLPLRDGPVECRWAPGRFAARTYQVTTELLAADGARLDLLTHPVTIREPAPSPDFMQIHDGDFFLHGKKWYAHGVNYMPSSGIGLEEGDYFEYWLDSQPYDPVVIQRDLERINELGFNMVSLFCYYRSLPSRNLLDILERCRRLGLRVNLSLRPGTPLDFRWDEMKALIEGYRLAENDTVFAYDLAWEPQFGNYARRRRWDGAWKQWVLNRYGSLPNAEADWGVSIPRAQGDVTGPSDEQCRQEGPHRIMVCAYRRFLDDLLAKAYGKANRLVKGIDPHHFTSFRMSVAGDPTVDPGWIGYDFRGLARSVDIMEPEGYGRSGDWNRVKPGRFTADYARCMAPGRPLLWAEFGQSTWDRDRMRPDPDREQAAGRFYDDFYRMVFESHADGSVCWWYPGGYRVGEASDFGVINPDGSWRPNSHVIHAWAPKLTQPRGRKRVDVWLTIDRDASVQGIVGVYKAVKDRYWQLIEQGKNPGLRTPGFGLNSRTAPRVAVGNVPYKPGRNPHKYLNAEFDEITVRNAEGGWQSLHEGGTVTVNAGRPLEVRVAVGNLGDAVWLSAPGPGQVGLSCGTAFLPLPHDVPFTGSAVIRGKVPPSGSTMTFVMRALPDVTFGERIHVNVQTR